VEPAYAPGPSSKDENDGSGRGLTSPAPMEEFAEQPVPAPDRKEEGQEKSGGTAARLQPIREPGARTHPSRRLEEPSSARCRSRLRG